MERKLVSVCFLDLLQRLAVQARFLAWESNQKYDDRYLKAITKALEKGREKKQIEYVWPTITTAQPDWENFICEVFDIQRLDEEKLTTSLFYYPWPVSVAEKDREILFLIFGKSKSLIGSADKSKIGEYADMIHILPEALKDGFVDRKPYFKGAFLPFIAKWPDFFSPAELSLIKTWSGSDEHRKGLKDFFRNLFQNSRF